MTQINIELIKSELTADAVVLRNVWETLEVKRQYANWAKDWLKMYTQGTDFVIINANVNNSEGAGLEPSTDSRGYEVKI